MVIDLSPMRGVRVDPDAGTARAGGGATWADLDSETQAFGLGHPGGVVSTTRIAGLTLGGRLGWLRRAHGLSCDHLVSADVVTADGRLGTASATQEPDLFWASGAAAANFAQPRRAGRRGRRRRRRPVRRPPLAEHRRRPVASRGRHGPRPRRRHGLRPARRALPAGHRHTWADPADDELTSPGPARSGPTCTRSPRAGSTQLPRHGRAGRGARDRRVGREPRAAGGTQGPLRPRPPLRGGT